MRKNNIAVKKGMRQWQGGLNADAKKALCKMQNAFVKNYDTTKGQIKSIVFLIYWLLFTSIERQVYNQNIHIDDKEEKN